MEPDDGRKGNGGADGADGAPPPWAAFFPSAEAYERFERTVRQHFLSRGQNVLIQGGRVVGPSLGEITLGLTNLAQLCAQHEEVEWPALVERHVSAVLSAQADAAGVGEDDFDAWRERLSIRIYAPEDVEGVRDVAVMREDVPGLRSVLCIDLPTAVHTVRRDQVERWGMSDDELFGAARRNLAELIDAEPQLVEVDEATSLWVLGGDSIYNSSLLLMLGRYPQIAGRHGVFLSAPTRHVVLALPFDSLENMNSIGHLIFFTTQFERDGPGSLSTRVWWQKDGRWMEIPWQMSDGGLSVRPPAEFTDLLETISEGEEGGRGA